MAEPALTTAALADLSAAWEFVAQRSEEAADRFLELFWERVNRHAAFPGMGRARDDLRPGARTFVVDQHLVFFRHVGDTVEILRVIHGSRDLKKALDEPDAG